MRHARQGADGALDLVTDESDGELLKISPAIQRLFHRQRQVRGLQVAGLRK